MAEHGLHRRPWSAGTWTTPPAAVREDGTDLLVTAIEGSDAWRHTSYGFVHDDAHALLAPLPSPGAVEVTFDLAWAAEFDQAGLMLGVAPVPDWAGRRVTVRASRDGDAVTVRARVDDEPLRLVRLSPFPEGLPVSAGPYCCAPTRAGIVVRFRRWATGPADAALH